MCSNASASTLVDITRSTISSGTDIPIAGNWHDYSSSKWNRPGGAFFLQVDITAGTGRKSIDKTGLPPLHSITKQVCNKQVKIVQRPLPDREKELFQANTNYIKCMHDAMFATCIILTGTRKLLWVLVVTLPEQADTIQ